MLRFIFKISRDRTPQKQKQKIIKIILISWSMQETDEVYTGCLNVRKSLHFLTICKNQICWVMNIN